MEINFADVIGQEEVKQRLTQLVQSNRVPHALLFCGPQGCGKMALAMAFARNLLISSSVSPENSEAMLRNWEHPDLHFTYPTIKLPGMSSEHQPVSSEFAKEWHEMVTTDTYFTVKQWMSQMGATTQQAIITGAESDELSKQLALKSSQGGYKVSIIWLPERMNLTSANKLLKLLEEPSARNNLPDGERRTRKAAGNHHQPHTANRCQAHRRRFDRTRPHGKARSRCRNSTQSGKDCPR